MRKKIGFVFLSVFITGVYVGDVCAKTDIYSALDIFEVSVSKPKKDVEVVQYIFSSEQDSIPYILNKYDYNSKGSVQETYTWVPSSSVWLPSVKNSYTKVDVNYEFNLSYTFNYETSEWRRQIKSEFKRGTDGNIILDLYNTWNNDSSWFELTKKIERTYNSKGKIKTIRFFNLVEEDVWQEDFFYEYKYDITELNLIWHYQYSFRPELGRLKMDFHEFWKYDSLGRIERHEKWKGSDEEIGLNKITYKYDSAYISLKTNYIWMGVEDGEWINLNQIKTYIGSNEDSIFEYSIWNNTTEIFELNYKEVLSYKNELLISDSTFNWNGSSWITDKILEKTYEDGYVSVITAKEWDNYEGRLFVDYKIYYNYDSFQIPTPIVLNSTSNQLNIFPNPANNYLIIEGYEKAFDCRIFNIQGQLVKQEHNVASKINVSDIPSGLYIIRISSKGKSIITRKFLKE